MKNEVIVQPEMDKRFWFKGGEVLRSKKVVKFPGRLANRKIMFTSHIVDSEIPMLWSRTGMVNAGVVLHMSGEGDWIFTTWVNLKLTKAGHYAIHILPNGKEKTRPTAIPQPPTLKPATLQTNKQKNLQEQETLLQNHLNTQKAQYDSDNDHSDEKYTKGELPKAEVPVQLEELALPAEEDMLNAEERSEEPEEFEPEEEERSENGPQDKEIQENELSRESRDELKVFEDK